MKSILISGCSTGVGRATALLFSSKGYKVFAGVRKDADAESLRQSDPAGNIEPVMLDITNQSQLDVVVANLDAQLADSGLTALVNNAGIAEGGPLEFIDPDVIRKVFEVNTMGPVILTQRFLPLIRRAKGRIITVGSFSGKVSTPMGGAYSISKYGIEAFNDALRRELAPFGIHVSLLEPGAIATPMLQNAPAKAKKGMQELPEQAREYYRSAFEGFVRYFAQMNENAISPDEAAKVIEHAVESLKPKTRYLVTKDAKLANFMNWILPDRWFDALVAGQMK